MPPPLNKTSATGCLATASNCVVWNGPDIPCLGICTGQNLSEVLCALATLLCTSTAGTVNLQALDLRFLFTETPRPPLSLTLVLQRLLVQVAGLSEQANAQPSDRDDAVVPLVRLPACLEFVRDEATVHSLPAGEYLQLLGQRVCALLSTRAAETEALQALARRTTQLERALRTLGIPLPDPTDS